MTDMWGKHLISRARVFHVGLLDPSRKHANSHEGSGLSVSLHPEAWRRIARLGDAPTYILRRRAARFMDVDRALNDAVLMNLVWGWATNNGYVLAGERFVVQYRDTEYEETRTLACSTHDDAVVGSREV